MDELTSADRLLEISDELDRVTYDRTQETASLQTVVDLTRKHLSSHVAILLVKNLTSRDHVLAVCAGGELELSAYLQKRCVHQQGRPCFWNLTQRGGTFEAYHLPLGSWDVLAPEVAQKYGLEAVLVCPLSIGGQVFGMLCHFASSSEPFSPETRLMLAFVAARAQTMIGQGQRPWQLERFQELDRITLELIAERDPDTLLQRMLEAGLRLVNADRGWVSRLDFRTGDLRIIHAYGNPQHRRALRPGRGITWQALRNEAPVLVHDVTAREWRDIYESYWTDTHSELAVPLIIKAAEVRQRCELTTGSKLIGVLNVESPLVGAFSEMDKELLHSLARHAAVLIDGLELDRRLAELTSAQQEMTSTKGWDNILELMGTTIAHILGFDYVNISLVTSDTRRIKTEYVLGIPDHQRDEFKRMADHLLDGADIQSCLVREPRTEVPDEDDPRFDQAIFRRFRHDRLIRVFVPMIASNKAVIGTVDAGYNRQYRQYIYEQDVRLLDGFIGYAVRALEQRQQSQIQRISHELSAPLGGIRSNASFLQRRREQLDAETMERKLGDIAVDAEILLLAVSQLEYLLSGRIGAALITAPLTPYSEPVLVFRDIIIKTVRQLKPLVISAGLDPERIFCDAAEFMRIPPLYLHQPKLNQVIYNLLLNAIKYAGAEPANFRIEIRAEAADKYLIKVRDWGIGIRADLADQVFNEGFRTPEAIARNVSGSGLGLTISRQLMRQMGGDLVLAGCSQPTEFHVILPRRLREAPKSAGPSADPGRPG